MASLLHTAVKKAEAAVSALPERLRYVFDFAQEKTGVKRGYFMLALSGFFAVYMIFGYFAELLCNLVGLVYPAYASTRAIESADHHDDTRWLTYWVVYACFTTLDFFADCILRFFPFYWLAKIVFLAYCFLPLNNNGSARIYNCLVRPYFLKSSKTVDSAYSAVAAKAAAAFESNVKEQLVDKRD